ncbi:MAG: hypothetical protein R3236_03715 [Phycisphaeraceae bacterium]|nr:hypothetical protein [Phycisphaeraceae bacterium]
MPVLLLVIGLGCSSPGPEDVQLIVGRLLIASTASKARREVSFDLYGKPAERLVEMLQQAQPTAKPQHMIRAAEFTVLFKNEQTRHVVIAADSPTASIDGEYRTIDREAVMNILRSGAGLR